MKIGILTLPFNNNYGGVLQAYALQRYLTERGHNVKHIMRVENRFKRKRSLIKQIKYFIKFILGKTIYQHERKISKNFRNFIYSKLNTTEIISNDNEFYKLNKYKFDAYIVGSDQVWRTDYTYDRYKNYFFDFIEYKNQNIKILSYAASFGKDEWVKDENETLFIENLIKRFNSVSVREKEGLKICNTKFNINAKQLIDPTLLLNKEAYINLLKKSRKKNGELLVYFLDPSLDKQNVVNLISDKYNYKPFLIGLNKIKSEIYPKIENWINGFNNAKFIITDSYHGCIFAIIFNKPFVLYANIDRGLSRFESLFDELHIENKIIFNSKDLNEKNFKNLDYKTINELIKTKSNLTSDYFENLGL